MKLGTSIKKFAWESVLKEARYNSKIAISLLRAMLIEQPDPFSNTGRLIYKLKQSNTDCWLINPVEFFLSNSTDNEKCVYLDLASKRNWADYEFKKQTSLPLYVAEDYYNIKLLESNILLEINDKSIDFKY